MRGAAVCTTGGVPCNRNTRLTGGGSSLDLSPSSRYFLSVNSSSLESEARDTYIGLCEDVLAGRQACHVRTKSQSVDMELETKPDDYSLEIGDGHEVKVEVQSAQPRSPAT